MEIRVLVAAGVFVVVFLFRLATSSITNDDYLHLSLAQQVLLGDVPVRDFIDPGDFLFYYLSAAIQFLFGRHLLSEVTLNVTLLATGYSLLCLLASHASRSYTVGVLVTTTAVLLMPRLYSYPKIFLYAVGLSLMWRYIDRQSTGRLLALAVCVAVAFLFRHDHGAYIAGASCVMLALTHWEEGWRTTGRKVLYFGSTIALLLVPFFVFLQLNGGLVSYWRNTAATGRAEYERTVGPYPRFRAAFASPRINVRWAAGLDASTRRALERRFRLEAAEDRGSGAWQYDLTDGSRQNVAALVEDPAVEDTGDVDRSRYAATAQVIEPNVLAWFYYLTVLLPPLALLTLVRNIWTGSTPMMAHEREKIASAVVLCALMHPFLLRAASQSAVADVSVLSAVLGAWLLPRGLMPWRCLGAWPAIRMAATTAILVGTLAAAWRSDGGYVLGRLVATLRNEGTDPIVEHLNELRLISAPFADAGARYVFDCTRESDRLLVTGYAPDLYYKSGRGFAAGRPHLLNSLAPLQESERFSIRLLMRQRVPIALAKPGSDDGFSPFTLVNRYVREHYRKAGEMRFGNNTYAVMVDARIPPVCSYGTERLPCFGHCAGAERVTE